MNDKIVTRDDLAALRALRSDCSVFEKDEQRLLDRLIAAAEADQPPLPEGWVLASISGMSFPYWHSDGLLYQGITDDDGTPMTKRDRVGAHNREWITPLRPTVTEADVERAAEAHRADRLGLNRYRISEHCDWNDLPEADRQGYVRSMHAAFKAAGIEVTS